MTMRHLNSVSIANGVVVEVIEKSTGCISYVACEPNSKSIGLTTYPQIHPANGRTADWLVGSMQERWDRNGATDRFEIKVKHVHLSIPA